MDAKFQKPKFPGCWFCENLVDYPGHIALLHLGFPRCIIIVRDVEEFYFSNYETFKSCIANIQWLDPSEQYTDTEREKVITQLWNFSIAQEQEEDRLAGLHNNYEDDDDL